MFFQDPSTLILIFLLITLLLIGAFFCLMRKRKAPVKKEEDLPGDIISQLRKNSGKMTEELFIQVQEEGINLIPRLKEIWQELSPKIQEELWEFWESQGYIDTYIKRLGAKDEVQCVEAAQVLMSLKNKKLILPLIDALTKPAQYVPARVAEVLLAYGSDAAEIMALRLPELPLEAKCQVISILEELGDSQGIPCLLQELAHPSPQVRMKAVDALGEVGSQEISESLIMMMNDPDWGVRARAAKALGKIKAPQGIPVLEMALQDDAWWVRKNAEEAIKKISY